MDPLINQGRARSHEKAGVSSGAKREAAPGRAARDAGGTEARLSQPPARSPGEPANTDRTLGRPGLNSGISTEPHRPAVGGRQLFLSICWEGGQRRPREGKQRPHYTGVGGGGEGGCKANTQLGPEAGSALLTGRLDAAGPAPTARGYREDRKEAKPAEAHRARSAAPGTVGGSRQSQQSRAGPGPPTAPARAETGHGRQPEAGGRLGQQAGPGPLWARGPDSRRASCADRAAAEWPAWLPQTAEQASARASGPAPLGLRRSLTPAKGSLAAPLRQVTPLSLLLVPSCSATHTSAERCSSPVTHAGGTAHHGCPGHTRPRLGTKSQSH